LILILHFSQNCSWCGGTRKCDLPADFANSSLSSSSLKYSSSTEVVVLLVLGKADGDDDADDDDDDDDDDEEEEDKEDANDGVVAAWATAESTLGGAGEVRVVVAAAMVETATVAVTVAQVTEAAAAAAGTQAGLPVGTLVAFVTHARLSKAREAAAALGITVTGSGVLPVNLHWSFVTALSARVTCSRIDLRVLCRVVSV
jgi:hypothetical protein